MEASASGRLLFETVTRPDEKRMMATGILWIAHAMPTPSIDPTFRQVDAGRFLIESRSERIGTARSEAERIDGQVWAIARHCVRGPVDIAPPIDGPTTAFDDEALLRADAQRARRLGFGGKLCIHPRQVAVVNACFTPSADEVAWARGVVDADAGAGGAAVAVDGKMVDRPVVLRAQSILADVAVRQE